MTPNPPLLTINDLFRRVVATANPRAVLWQDEFGQWLPISSGQIYQRVRALAGAFLGWGAVKGERIALISENRWEWAVTDFATLAIGAVNVPLYPTLTGEQMAALVADAGCRIAVVSTRQHFDKLHAVRGQTQLERIVMMDSAAVPEGAVAFSEALAGADERGNESDPVFDALVRSIKPDDPATLIYTSGTQGRGAHPRQCGR
jgi:long-chain acyl-CoA synthetase